MGAGGGRGWRTGWGGGGSFTCINRTTKWSMQRKILAQFVRFVADWRLMFDFPSNTSLLLWDQLCSPCCEVRTFHWTGRHSHNSQTVFSRFCRLSAGMVYSVYNWIDFVVLAPAWSIPSTIGLTAGNTGHTCFARGKRISGVSDICQISR